MSFLLFFFFFKQKTAYEMRISDWSSDVCSSDLRSVGVLLSAQATEAKAAAMGLEQVNGQYTEGAKVQARAALIMAQLKDAHGDVIRTSGSTENPIKRMNAAFEELRVMVGTQLLPVITQLIEQIASARNKSEERREGKEGV